MWFYYLVSVLALVTAFISTYTDLKDRIIPNRLTYPMVVVGIVLYLVWGVYQWEWMLAITGGLWAGLTFAIGYGMWFVGGWAGGDVKLYTALGALLGGFSAGEYSLVGVSEAPYPLPITVLLNGVICLAPVLITYTAVKSIKTPGIGSRILEPIRNSIKRLTSIPLTIVGGTVLGLEISSILGFGHITIQMATILGLFLIMLLIPIKLGTALSLGLSIYGIYIHSITAVEYLIIAFVGVFGISFLISLIDAVNRHVLQEKITIEDLEEGMISAETIYEEDGEVKRYKGPGFFRKLKNFFKTSNGQSSRPEQGRILADSRRAAGVSKKEVEKLRSRAEENKIENHIRIRKSIPFGPSFGLGVPIAILLGDIYWFIILNVGGI